jgi:hypothetical protein
MTGVTPVRTLSEVRTARNSLLGLDWILKSGRIKSVEENIVQDHLAEIQSQPEKPWLKIALFSVLGLVLVGGLIFAAVKVGVPSKPQPKACSTEAKICPDGSAVGRTGPNCEFAPCPNQVTQDETADWKTYENSYFRIKVPSSYTYEEKSLAISKDYPNILSYVEFKTEDGFINIAVANNYKKLTLENALGSGPMLSYVQDFLVGKEIQKIVVDDIPAIMVKDIPTGMAGTGADLIIIRNQNIYQIVLSPRLKSNKQVFDQILSTFKFLE